MARHTIVKLKQIEAAEGGDGELVKDWWSD